MPTSWRSPPRNGGPWESWSTAIPSRRTPVPTSSALSGERGCGANRPTARPAAGCSAAGTPDRLLLLLLLLLGGLVQDLRVVGHSACRVRVAEGGLGGKLLDVPAGALTQGLVIRGGHGSPPGPGAGRARRPPLPE